MTHPPGSHPHRPTGKGAAGAETVLVTAVGAQLMPAFVAVEQLGVHRVVAVHTEDVEPQVSWFDQVFSARGVTLTRVCVSPHMTGAIRSRLSGTLRSLEPAALVFDLTGGTKPMAIAMLEEAAARGAGAFYLDSDRGRYLTVLPQGERDRSTPVIRDMEIPLILASRGKRIHRWVQPDASLAQLARWMGTHPAEARDLVMAYRKGRTKLSHVAGQVSRTLLALLDSSGMTGGGKISRQPAAKSFLKGDWLAMYTFLAAQQAGFAHVMMNVEIEDADLSRVWDEIDVVMGEGTRLFVCECKAMWRGKGQRPLTAGDLKEVISHLEMQRRTLGGRYTRAMLVVSSGVNASVRQRARDLRIDLVDRKRLPKLPDLLLRFREEAFPDL